MARTKNTKNLRNETPVTIPRNYDIYSIEKRVHDLETGGSTPTPTPTSWDYSTDEVNTNQKWIDGNDIYCKVLDYSSSPVSLPSNSEKLINGALPTNTRIVDADIIYSNGTWTGIAKAYVTLNNGNLGINSMHAVNMYYAIIRYIKIGE